MLKNYIKIAFKVFLRRKFFTCVSLFGISFTLMVLMVATAFIDQEVGPIPPEVHTDRTLYLSRIFMHRASTDSSGKVLNEYSNNGSPSYAFLDRYVRTLETAEQVAVFSAWSKYRGAYSGTEATDVSVILTDDAFWEVFRFNFREGRPYTTEEVQSGDFVAVVSMDTRKRIFGREPAVGRKIAVDGQGYRVVGVVADVSQLRNKTRADMWIPLTASRSQSWRDYKLQGDFQAAILAPQVADLPRIKAEFRTVLEQVEPPPKEHASHIGVSAPLFTLLEEWTLDNRGEWTKEYTRDDLDYKPLVGHVYQKFLTIGLYMLLFMLLPAVNLVNINISRIEERAAEIGVRKAFGASGNTLVGQFVMENVLLTLMGGVIGLPLSYGILGLVALSGLGVHIDLQMLLRTFFYGLTLAVFFGVLSGAYPAWKMARLHPVQALTGREQ